MFELRPPKEETLQEIYARSGSSPKHRRQGSSLMKEIQRQSRVFVDDSTTDDDEYEEQQGSTSSDGQVIPNANGDAEFGHDYASDGDSDDGDGFGDDEREYEGEYEVEAAQELLGSGKGKEEGEVIG
jgi:hypothetical protein